MKRILVIMFLAGLVVWTLSSERPCFMPSMYFNDPGAPTKKIPVPCGRIELLNPGYEYKIGIVESNGIVHDFSPGEQKNVHRAITLDVKEKWEKLIVEFTPEESGTLLIVIRGGYFEDMDKNPRKVWVDDVAVSEGLVVNGGFEKIGENGAPEGWGAEEQGIAGISTDGSEAHSGKVSVLVWHDQPLVTECEVEKGKKYILTAYFKSEKK